jgi:hypothetical protein
MGKGLIVPDPYHGMAAFTYGRWMRYEDLRDALNSPAKKETP